MMEAINATAASPSIDMDKHHDSAFWFSIQNHIDDIFVHSLQLHIWLTSDKLLAYSIYREGIIRVRLIHLDMAGPVTGH